MSEKTLLYGLAFLTICLAAGLLIARNLMIARLSDEQIRLIFKEERHTEAELGTVNRTLVKIRTVYPSLLFLLVGAGLAVLAFLRVTDMTDWLVKGQFVLPRTDTAASSPDWRGGILTLFPAEVETKVGPGGAFEIRARIPDDETFESQFSSFTFATRDERYRVDILTKEELERFRSGSENSLLKKAENGLRIYGDITVSVVPLTKREVD